ncbi:hypothetical protein HK096_010595 [Nowakowskiella sp. JEL0078]|nr:hypothetical protein HK096_010595 [Nowakowskiella sp. JEL0078]
MNVLGLILRSAEISLRLRQACNHAVLVGTIDKAQNNLPEKQNEDNMDELELILNGLSLESIPKCVVCLEPIQTGTQCAECESTMRDIVIASGGVQIEVGNIASGTKVVQSLQRDWVTSTKIEKTLEILKEIREREGPREKTIIFSQFTTMLDILEIPLRKCNIKFGRYDGAMKNLDREESLRRFREDKSIEVLLISLKAGSVGLNLTDANNVIMFELYWNPAIEDQAIDRVHRIGQEKKVHVHQLIVNGTIEERILTIQNKKRELINGTLGESSFKRGKKNNVSMEELKYLLMGPTGRKE